MNFQIRTICAILFVAALATALPTTDRVVPEMVESVKGTSHGEARLGAARLPFQPLGRRHESVHIESAHAELSAQHGEEAKHEADISEATLHKAEEKEEPFYDDMDTKQIKSDVKNEDEDVDLDGHGLQASAKLGDHEAEVDAEQVHVFIRKKAIEEIKHEREREEEEKEIDEAAQKETDEWMCTQYPKDPKEVKYRREHPEGDCAKKYRHDKPDSAEAQEYKKKRIAKRKAEAAKRRAFQEKTAELRKKYAAFAPVVKYGKQRKHGKPCQNAGSC